MRIDIITLFPKMFEGPLTESIIKRAVEKDKVTIVLHNLRDYALDKHGTVDDTPYGGGAGMVLKVDVLDRALQQVIQQGQKEQQITELPYRILTTPQGQVYKQSMARQLATKRWCVIVCGHYEGYDERIRQFVDSEISIGDYILTGGEIPALALIDSLVRLLPGVIGKEASHQDESHETGLLEYPHYTRPEKYKGLAVPELLLKGNHAAIASWRQEQAEQRTKERRPDLLGREIDKNS